MTDNIEEQIKWFLSTLPPETCDVDPVVHALNQRFPCRDWRTAVSDYKAGRKVSISQTIAIERLIKNTTDYA